jgi:sulfatase maturation enzyme AslB (radical SAM superfamily)
MVSVGASIDGMEEVLEYQRYPLKWNTALKNLKALDSVAVDNNNIIPSMKYTVSAYNVFHLPKFMWWKLFDSGFKKVNDVDHKPIIGYHMVYEPYRVCTQMLSLEIKNKLKAYYSEWEEKFKNSDLPDNIKEVAVDILQSVITFTFLEDRSNELPEFVKFTRYLDQKRKQDIRKIVPELGELFD